MHELAAVLAPDGGKRAVDLIQRNVTDLVDDWCGTHPYPKPYPWPWGPIIRSTDQLQPIELIVAGAQFQKAADALKNSVLCQTFQEAANRLLKTGVSRLEEAD